MNGVSCFFKMLSNTNVLFDTGHFLTLPFFLKFFHAPHASFSSQYNNAGVDGNGVANAPLIQSFHVLAALRICAITEQCKKRGELAPLDSTFDMPTFRCLLRPGDLGAALLNKSGYVSGTCWGYS